MSEQYLSKVYEEKRDCLNGILFYDNLERTGQPEYVDINLLVNIDIRNRIDLLTNRLLHPDEWNLKKLVNPKSALYSMFPFLVEDVFDGTTIIGGLLLNLILNISTKNIDLDIAIDNHEKISEIIEIVKEYYNEHYTDNVIIVTSKRFPLDNNCIVKNVIYINIFSNNSEVANQKIPNKLQEIQLILVDNIKDYICDFDISISKVFIDLGPNNEVKATMSASMCLLLNSFPINSVSFSIETKRRILKYVLMKKLAILLPNNGAMPTKLYYLKTIKSPIGFKIINMHLNQNFNVKLDIYNGYENGASIIESGKSLFELEPERISAIFRNMNYHKIQSEKKCSLFYIISVTFGKKICEKYPSISSYSRISYAQELHFEFDLFNRFRLASMFRKLKINTEIQTLNPQPNIYEISELLHIILQSNHSIRKIYNQRIEVYGSENILTKYFQKYEDKSREMWERYFGKTVESKISSFNRIDISEDLWEISEAPLIIINKSEILNYIFERLIEKKIDECCICLNICNPSNGNYASICGKHLYHIECYISYRQSSNNRKLTCPYCRQ
jgi:hypothetical protein